MKPRCLAAALAVGLLAVPAAASARQVRAFAVGPKLDLAWLDTRRHFHDKLFALVDRSRRGPAAPQVQKGVDDVASHLLSGDRNLVAFPEDLGLMAIFSGEQGRTARTAQSITEAIVDVALGYGPQVAYYSAKYPQLAERPIPTRLLAVAATDTFGRVAVETYAELAATYHVWLEAGAIMTRQWQVVCMSKAAFTPPAGGVGCDEENPAKVAQLRGPDEPSRTYVYEATSDQASNMSLLFDPSGRLVAKEAKSYLTPTELPGQLDLYPNAVDGLRAIDTPVGRLGFAISRDAFTPMITHLLDQRRVELLVQPEFFVNDLPVVPGMWSPDTLKASGYSALLRYPAIQALVVPSMTGNIFDFSADAQQHIAIKPRSRRPATGYLVGQDPAAGFTKVAPYVVADPATADEGLEARRKRIADAAKKLPRDGKGLACSPPDEPGACRNGQVESVLFQDLQVGLTRRVHRQKRRRRGKSPFTVNRPLAPSAAVQRNAALAARGRTVVAALEEHAGAHDQLVVARSADGGRHWRRVPRVTGLAPGAADEWWPAVAIGPDRTVWLAWSDDASGHHRVRVAHSTDGGRTFSAPVAADEEAPEASQYKASIAAPAPGRAIVAWVGMRGEQSGEPGVPEAGIWTTTVPAGGNPSPAARMDGIEPKDQTSLDNAWSPSLASSGARVLLSYTDSATADWRVWSRESTDRGATFGPEKPVNDTPPVKTSATEPPENEALDESPASAETAAGPLVAFTDFRKHDASERAHSLYDTFVTVPGATNLQIDQRGDRQLLTFFPAIAAAGKGAIVAWQDHARGPGDVFAARVAGGRVRRRVRVDDSGRNGWNQWRPALAISGRRVVAAWEDERDGPAQIFVARAALRRFG